MHARIRIVSHYMCEEWIRKFPVNKKFLCPKLRRLFNRVSRSLIHVYRIAKVSNNCGKEKLYEYNVKIRQQKLLIIKDDH